MATLKVRVRMDKLGFERDMTRKSFDYLSAKKRGVTFLHDIPDRQDVGTSEVQRLKEQIKAQKAEAEAGQQTAHKAVTEALQTEKKKPGRPAKEIKPTEE